MKKELIEQFKNDIGAAQQKLSKLCSGEERWVMHIPAQPDYDHDLVIGLALRDADRMLEMLEGTSNGAAMIFEERTRQLFEEGWSAEHDDEHSHGELVLAAITYASSTLALWPVNFEDVWPWDHKWWKPSDHIRNLEKAGALIAAEIDRLKRLDPHPSSP